MRKEYLLLALCCLLVSPAPQASDDKAIEQRIVQAMHEIAPDVVVGGVRPTPVAGIYEVMVGAQILYFSADGRYMIQGEMLDLKERRSLSEPRRQEARLSTIGTVSEKSMLIYPAKGQKKHVITVFTDIDCGYCRRLHQHMAEMNERGIEVHYLFMPRAGLDSDSYRKAVAVWCAEEPRQAMTEAKLGKNVSYKECANPVRDHMALAEEMGVNATPTIITGKGSLWPGYLPPGELLQRLESEDAPVRAKK